MIAYLNAFGKFCISVPLAIIFSLPMLAHSDSELPTTNPIPSEPDLEPLMSILRTVPEKGWVQVNDNQMQDVWTPPGLLVGDGGGAPWGPRSLIDAWSSFAWDSRRGDLIIYGGGHANYAGNEVYRWRATTRQWERMSLPSNKPLQDYPFLTEDGPDASPQAAHTYDNNIYLPIVDRFLTFGGPTYGLGHAYEIEDPSGVLHPNGKFYRVTGPYLFDPSRADENKVGGLTGSHPQWDNLYLGVIGGEMWENRDIPKNLPSAPFPTHFIEGSTGYTQENGKDVVFVHGQQSKLSKYTINDIDNPALDEWEQVGQGVGWRNGIGAYLPTHNLFVRISYGLFSYWDLSPGTAGPTNSNVPFDPGGPDLDARSVGVYGLSDYGMDYDAPRGRFLLWGGGGDVFSLTPPAGVSPVGWSLVQLPSAVPATPTPDHTPSVSPGTGVLGKWKYIAQLDAFMALQDRYEGNVWLYKPEGWTEPTIGNDPQITLAEPTSKGFVLPGSSIVVTADIGNPVSNLTSVQLLWNGNDLATFEQPGLAPPYTATLNTATLGTHSFEAVATLDNGEIYISPRVSVTVASHINNPPSVSMSSPLAGPIAYVEGRDLALSAVASDTDGTIAQVEFFLNGSSLGVDTTAPHSILWEVEEGSYMLTAVATDDTNITATSAAVAIDVTPHVDLVVLQEGLSGYAGTTDTYLDSYHTALAFGGVEQLKSRPTLFNPLVRFAIFSSEGGPVPDGATVTYAALALYKASEYDYTYSAHPLLVDWSESQATWTQAANGTPWNSPGAGGSGTDYAAIGSPATYAVWDPGWVVFDVTDSVQSMSGGQQNNGWQLLGTGPAYQKTFRASEYLADPSLRPKLILQYDENTNSRPTAALTAPGEGASYTKGDTVSLSANASDTDGSVTQVGFFYNNISLGVDNTPPYTLDWNNVPVGTHTLTAVAIDDAYAPGTSAPVNITVPPSGC